MKNLITPAVVFFLISGIHPQARSASIRRLPAGPPARVNVGGYGGGWSTGRPSGEKIAARAFELANDFRARTPGRDYKGLSDLVGKMKAFNAVYGDILGPESRHSTLWESHHEEFNAFLKAYSAAAKEYRKMRSAKIKKGMANTAKALGSTSEEDGVNAAGGGEFDSWFSKDRTAVRIDAYGRRYNAYGLQIIELEKKKQSAKIRPGLKKAAAARRDSERELAYVRTAFGKVEKIARRLAKERGITITTPSLFEEFVKEASALFAKESKAPSLKAAKTAAFVLGQVSRIMEVPYLLNAQFHKGKDHYSRTALNWRADLVAGLDTAVSLDNAERAAQRTADEALNAAYLHYSPLSSRDAND